MRATITKSFIGEEDVGQCFAAQWESHDDHHEAKITRRFNAYDDDGERYYTLSVDFADENGEDELGDLLSQLGAYAGVTELRDITGDGINWSAG